MPRVIITRPARRGLERCRYFLLDKHPQAAKRASETIRRQLGALGHAPEIGRKYTRRPELRELIIGFGVSGYVALYRYNSKDDAVYILAFRHQKEAGY